jgi:hypothetical protein
VTDRVTRAALVAVAAVGLATAAAVPAYATAETEHGTEAQVDLNPNTENPCTGAIGDLVDDERDSWSVTTRSDGSSLARGHAVTDVTFTPYDEAAESYAGHETFSSVERVTRGADGFRSTQRVRMRGSEGGLLLVTQTVHVTVRPDGTVAVDRGSMELSCG